mmetsp:Transcript_105681/g.187932  ORF Transcript_105681/g.187932 Transcript_105681/m.187932 type:complete len:184 (+) Transcript_105681:79-630(+)|eukprot:CAMPEP_0197654742 /NCGR_PEP_ID=MMETSP1338-20131121/39027_1 /TAXON_ID=43686 ORGANISM="Pelagodinium beii, Strain RCC1491" /NCGR_SAMPLE_ID=MMETSP1338 /ASSEMBLY_ACC=CAM_ASM_000754 /LENGTH=183 /DNA_ID=CAMNT_0043230237 /DNA_START=72 /DNA_END=623 /DNA_ORIENTATION=+
MGAFRLRVVAMLMALLFVTANGTIDAFDAAPSAAASSTEGPAMKNLKASVRHARKHRPTRHSQSFEAQHLEFQHHLVAQSQEEAEQAQQREKAVFERGRNLRARKALFEHKLATCKGDKSCADKMARKQREVELLVASGKAPRAVVEGIDEQKAQASVKPTQAPPRKSWWFADKLAWAASFFG